MGLLDGRVALVTGGNGGLGFAIATALGSAGATVAICGRDSEKTDRARASLVAKGIRASSHVAELVDERSCVDLAADVYDVHRRIDILINNAGINLRKRPEDYTSDEVQQIVQVDLIAPFHLAVAVFKGSMAQNGGKIVNIGSLLSTFGGERFAPYSAAKGGLIQVTRSLAVAWAPQNIQVNAILPGWIDTDLTAAARQQVPGLNERVLQGTPAGRWGRPEDIGAAAVFLASPGSDFITGAALPIDGGYSIAV